MLFVLSFLGSMVGASVLACREALHYAFRQMVFVLNGNEIIRRRQGYPEVKIAFSEVESLSEERRYLIVKSGEPRKKIAIPRTVRGYEAILTELAKHCPISARKDLPLRSIALLAISLSSWTAILWSADNRVVIAAGGVALITLAIGSRRLWALLRGTSKSPLMWSSLGFAWLLALLLIYLRVARP
jgi:hypothetical protein